jgi:hypothetical protein
LEYCNLGTAKRNPGPRRFDRGNVRIRPWLGENSELLD